MAIDEWVTGRVVLKVRGVPLDLEMTVPATPVKPHRMLPVFHQMANSFSDIGVNGVESEGKNISCKAGCYSCCIQPVPISEIEAYQIAELVESLPEERRNMVKQKFADAHEHFQRSGWFDKFHDHYRNANTDADERKNAVAAVHRYFEEGIPCPFLEGGMCSIHSERPVSCREYLVTSSPEDCASLDGRGIEMVQLPLKTSAALVRLAQSQKGRKAGQLLLIEALKFVDDHPEQFEEKVGEGWMAEFFNNLMKSDSGTASTQETVGVRRKKRHKKH
jgi:Fe-S-cluster containining protein